MIVLNAEFVKKFVQLATLAWTKDALTLNIIASSVSPVFNFAQKKQSTIRTKPKVEKDTLTLQ